MCVFNKPFVKIKFEKEKGILVQTWKGFCVAEDFKEAITFSMDFLEKNNIYKILSDIRKQRSVSPKEQEFVTSKIEEFISKNGKFNMSFILPESILAEMGVKYFALNTKKKLKKEVTRFFDNIVEAEKWLLSV